MNPPTTLDPEQNHHGATRIGPSVEQSDSERVMRFG